MKGSTQSKKRLRSVLSEVDPAFEAGRSREVRRSRRRSLGGKEALPASCFEGDGFVFEP